MLRNLFQDFMFKLGFHFFLNWIIYSMVFFLSPEAGTESSYQAWWFSLSFPFPSLKINKKAFKNISYYNTFPRYRKELFPHWCISKARRGSGRCEGVEKGVQEVQWQLGFGHRIVLIMPLQLYWPSIQEVGTHQGSFTHGPSFCSAFSHLSDNENFLLG